MSRWDVDQALAQVSNEVAALEQFRQEVLASRSKGAQVIGLVIAGAIVAGFLGVVVTESLAAVFIGIFLGVVGVAIAHHVYYGRGAEQYRWMFKTHLLSKWVSLMEPGVTFEPQSGIEESLFVGSDLFKERPDRYGCEDLIQGMIGKTQVRFSEVHAETKHTSTDSNGNRSTHWKTLFEGIFFIADFNKEFRSPVMVMPDVAEKNFGWLGKKLQKLGGGLQTMENPEFERHFVVRGADAVEARYILTPAMQERLLGLRGKLGRGLRVGFRSSHVWLAIPNASDWFEGDLKLPAGDQRQTQMLLGQLRTCFELVEELDLNTRIWTKE